MIVFETHTRTYKTYLEQALVIQQIYCQGPADPAGGHPHIHPGGIAFGLC